DEGGSVADRRKRACGIAQPRIFLGLKIRRLAGHEESEALGRIVTILEGRREWMAEAESGLEQRLAETSDVLKEAIAALDAVSFDGGH
ncbi:hypothetical protein ACC708_36390, partial [Rhizobium ruizarguesonis]